MSDTALPIISRPIDNTAMSAFMACPREYQLAMIRGYRSKKKKTAPSYGSFWHKLLETHYKTGGDSAAILATFAKHHKTVGAEPGEYRTAERALLDYNRYIKKYEPRRDCNETIGFPHAPLVEMNTAIRLPSIGHEYAVKIDRLIVIDGLGYVEDTKTTSRLDKHYFSQFRNSNQMKGYVVVARHLVKDIKVVGVRINLAHVLTAKTEFERSLITYPDSILDEWEQNAKLWIGNIERAVETNSFPMHFGDNGCSRKFGQCEFFEVCHTSPTIRESVLEQEFEIRHWDPLDDGDEIT